MTTSLDPDEIKRVKLHSVKCSKCKANLMVRPTEKVCPVVGVRWPSLESVDSNQYSVPN